MINELGFPPPVGLNPSNIIKEESSTYLLIKKWSKLNAEVLALIGRFLSKWTSIEPVWNKRPDPLSAGVNIFPTVYVKSSLPSNLNSSPYFIDQGNSIGLKPDPVISVCLTFESYSSTSVEFEEVITYG